MPVHVSFIYEGLITIFTVDQYFFNVAVHVWLICKGKITIFTFDQLKKVAVYIIMDQCS